MHTRRTLSATACGIAMLAATACSSSFGEDEDTAQEDTEGSQSLTVLIATSGEAETGAVEAAAAAYEEESGNTVTVEVAQDMNQQLGQALAGGNPPDVFYVDSSQFANYAQGGSLHPYGERISDVEDFSPTLRQSFTHEGELVCVPKDTSSLALVINTALWQEAGLTDADYPTTWEQLSSVAAELTQGDVTGLVTSNEYQRLGAFMKQAGGWVTNADQTEVTADSDENAEALDFVRGMLNDGSLTYASDVDAGWAGEAFGEGRAAMTIEGSWLAGGMEADYPDVEYAVVPLPEGPAGPGTLAFTNCWGVAQESPRRDTAVELVEFLTRAEQQIAMGDAFGAIPSRQSAADEYLADHPEDEAWGASGEWVQGPVTLRGFDRVLAQFNTDLESLRTADPRDMLSDLQRYGEAALEENQ
ncbi:extracellular solute-binding protein [Streptomyces sp. PT12]|uniref:sugar ABC transporter substrate-binding protein n=1 Tax=Streptomyces sp. PT12 TaxID=1510197 RepID=UPI000DE23F5B|nr:extracellular solute-binding protein [Streptomyces sp. PT12]RBM16639.1 ABC transporter substrate-binding protein [Streptomyces sp. PT12]